MTEPDGLEDALRDWGRAARSSAPPVRVGTYESRRRVRWLVPITAAATIVAVAVGVVTIRGASDHSPVADSQGPSKSTNQVTPDGKRVVVFHGLALFVPSTWGDNLAGCGGDPVKDTVITTLGSVATCGRVGPITASFVRWERSPESGYVRPLTDPQTRDTSVSGLPATVTTGMLDNLHVAKLVVPSLTAIAVIASPDGDVPEQIARSAHVSGFDANGCPAKTPVNDLASLPASSIPGSAQRLIPGNPNDLLVCRYNKGWLEQSGRPAGAPLSVEIGVLNELPPGYSVANPRTSNLAICAKDPHAGIVPGRPADLYLIHVGYADDSRLTLAANVAFCGDLGITNGSFDAQDSEGLMQILFGLAGTSTGGAGDTIPAK